MLREVVMEKERAEVAGLNAEGAKAVAVERVAAAKMAENFMVMI
jgi:hypothetical protein